MKYCPKPSLPLEYRFYKLLDAHLPSIKSKGIAQMLYFGNLNNQYNCLILEMLGPSLDSQMRKLKKFSLKTTLQLANQIINIIEYVHEKGIVYRDIKGENFLLGLESTPASHKVHLIDFGLSKEYKYDNEHIPFRIKNSYCGTPRYMSLNSHQMFELSRRDDLEAISYLIAWFLRGKLPWQGLIADHQNENIHETIYRIKKSISSGSLFEGFPNEFAQYLNYVKGLQFEEDPDYKKIKELFQSAFQKNNYPNDNKYDWDSEEQFQVKKSNRKSIREPQNLKTRVPKIQNPKV